MIGKKEQVRIKKQHQLDNKKNFSTVKGIIYTNHIQLHFSVFKQGEKQGMSTLLY